MKNGSAGTLCDVFELKAWQLKSVWSAVIQLIVCLDCCSNLGRGTVRGRKVIKIINLSPQNIVCFTLYF